MKWLNVMSSNLKFGMNGWSMLAIAALMITGVGFGLSTRAEAETRPGTTMQHFVSISEFIGTVRFVESDAAKLEILSASQGTSGVFGFEIDHTDDATVRVHGTVSPGSMNCIRKNGELQVSIDNSSAVPVSALPEIVISAPRSSHLELSVRAGDVSIGESGRLDAIVGGCTSIDAGTVNGEFHLRTTGSAQVRVGRVVRASIDATQGGMINVETVTNGLEARLGGTARLFSDQIDGDSRFVQAGSSQVLVSMARMDTLDVTLDGASRFGFQGDVLRASFDIRSAARAVASGKISLQDVQLLRAGRLTLNGERWRDEGI
ncbi:MAG: hypothetical protein KJ871_08590 [Alphaproteobacteria bacterium]|nr:hypothetical protein [Alphaproteobacteria bacterium]MBU2144611.1 hypothetical protein [Alphaproteobacteria bacterium]MBU2195374.1 hypothetical protein [Alphaproteobacteria bacterium]